MLVNGISRLKNGFNRRFLIKTSSFCALAFLAGSAFSNSSYSLGIETQDVVRCLPQILWLLDEDVNIEDIQHGSLVRIHGNAFNKYFDDEVDLLKMVVGMEGDTVTIDANTRTLFINDRFFGKLAASKPPVHTGEYIIQPGEIWIAGTSDTAIDSRYFGPAKLSMIEAHAYALL